MQLLNLIVFFCLASFAVCYPHEHDYHHSHPHYKFEYGVKDGHTGDHKSQWEHRDGDKVKGGYTLHEADGTKRVVEYTADHHNGFHAVVKRVGHAVHPHHYHHHHEGHHGGEGHGHGHGHGHATSYANHNQHHHHHEGHHGGEDHGHGHGHATSYANHNQHHHHHY